MPGFLVRGACATSCLQGSRRLLLRWATHQGPYFANDITLAHTHRVVIKNKFVSYTNGWIRRNHRLMAYLRDRMKVVTSDDANPSGARITLLLFTVSGTPTQDICNMLPMVDRPLRPLSKAENRTYTFPPNHQRPLPATPRGAMLIMHVESCRAPRVILRGVATHSTTRLPYLPKGNPSSDLGFRLIKNNQRLSRAAAEYTTTSVTTRMQ